MIYINICFFSFYIFFNSIVIIYINHLTPFHKMKIYKIISEDSFMKSLVTLLKSTINYVPDEKSMNFLKNQGKGKEISRIEKLIMIRKTVNGYYSTLASLLLILNMFFW